jgi:hypothetical protein
MCFLDAGQTAGVQGVTLPRVSVMTFGVVEEQVDVTWRMAEHPQQESHLSTVMHIVIDAT